MEHAMRKTPGSDAAPARDWFLQFLVNQANKNSIELDITLTVGGFLSSGTLAGVRQYFDDLGAYFAGPFISGDNPEEVQSAFRSSATHVRVSSLPSRPIRRLTSI